MTSVSWHGSIKIMTSYQMVWCHNCFYLKLWGTTIKLKKHENICHLQRKACMGHRTKRILRIERKEYQTY